MTCFRRPGSFFAAIAVTLVLAPAARADAGWLDAPPRVWNTPGAAVPPAPPASGIAPSQCGAQERSAISNEEANLVAAGWRLENYWQPQRAGSTSLVMATADYDGMCRPWQFNTFVFVDEVFAGTLSPAPMNSRFDGALTSAPQLTSLDTIEAVFTRYAESDPLCCPSRPPTQVSYQVVTEPGGRYVVPMRIATVARLPQTGAAPDRASVVIGVLAAAGGCATGLALRRRSLSPAMTPAWRSAIRRRAAEQPAR